MKNFCLFVLLSQCCIHVASGVRLYERNNTDSYLTSLQMITKYGYPAESHLVQTEDGYILELHRIPHGKNAKMATKRPPVFLHHGLMGSSADYILIGPEKGLPFLLADEGYDVWLGNIRGNTYSRAHVSLTPEDTKFWNFSWHEAGLKDLPAEIDFICNHTQSDELIYLGHSMGTTMYLVMASQRPEYQKKVRVAIFLAVIAYLNNTRSPIQYLAPLSNKLQSLFDLVRDGEFLQQNRLYRYLVRFACTLNSIERELCRSLIFMYAGSDPQQLNQALLPIILNHLPAGTSAKCLSHYGQLIVSGKFREYDYGPQQNMIQYNSTSPPDYNVEAIQTPIYVFEGENDFLSTKTDAIRLAKRLPNLKGIEMVKYPLFNHVDFIFANDVRHLLYDKVMNLIRNYTYDIENDVNFYFPNDLDDYFVDSFV